MDPITINVTDLRMRTREIMERVKYKGEKFVVYTFGQPTAIVLSLDEYENITKIRISHDENPKALTA